MLIILALAVQGEKWNNCLTELDIYKIIDTKRQKMYN